MNKTKYKITKNNNQFGIIISNKTECVEISDISDNKSEIIKIIRRLSPYNIEPMIAKEIISDLLYEFTAL